MSLTSSMLGPFIKSIMIPTCFTWEPAPLKAHSPVSKHILKPEGLRTRYIQGHPAGQGQNLCGLLFPGENPRGLGQGEGAFCAGAQTPGPGSQESVGVWSLLASFQVIRKPHFYVLLCQPSPTHTYFPGYFPIKCYARKGAQDPLGRKTQERAPAAWPLSCS